MEQVKGNRTNARTHTHTHSSPVQGLENLAPEKLGPDVLEDNGAGRQLGQLAGHLFPVARLNDELDVVAELDVGVVLLVAVDHIQHVEEDLFDHVGPLNKAGRLAQRIDNTLKRFKIFLR